LNRNETFGSGGVGATSQHKHDFGLINTAQKRMQRPGICLSFVWFLGYSYSAAFVAVVGQMLPLSLANLAWDSFVSVPPFSERPALFPTPWKSGDNGFSQVDSPGSAIFFCIFGVKFVLHLANLMPFFHNITGGKGAIKCKRN